MPAEQPQNLEPTPVQAGENALLRFEGGSDWVTKVIVAIIWWTSGTLKITYRNEYGTHQTTRVVDPDNVRPAPNGPQTPPTATLGRTPRRAAL